jgi:membrane-bound lytic murein transglycosylase MltF
MTETSIGQFFERYAQLFNQGLSGEVDLAAVAACYAAEFIAASPAGVSTGRNDAGLRQVMQEGYVRYRALGTKQMRIRRVAITPLDDLHCVAHVAWTAAYAQEAQPDLEIEFTVHYLMQELNAGPQIFGWVSGDEQQLLREHGIV